VPSLGGWKALVSNGIFHKCLQNNGLVPTNYLVDSLSRHTAPSELISVDNTVDMPHQSFSGFLDSPILLNAFDRFLRHVPYSFLI
jgi:hypothetical protein